MSGDNAELTFEQALARLDEVVARLESGDVGLEEAVGLFEEGQRYLALCTNRLALAQQRIEELTGPAQAAGDAAPGASGEPF